MHTSHRCIAIRNGNRKTKMVFVFQPPATLQPPKRVRIVAYLLIIISIVSAVQSLPQTTKLRSHINWNLECMINRNQRQVWTGEILSPLRVRAKTKQSINKTGTAEAEGRGNKELDTVRTKNKCPNMHIAYSLQRKDSMGECPCFGQPCTIERESGR